MTAPALAPLLASAPIAAGSPQGGVWKDEALGCWAFTCQHQACSWFVIGFDDPEHAAISMRVHERDCVHCPKRRRTDRPAEYQREDPEDVPVPVPDGVELIRLGAGPDRRAAPAPMEVAA